MPATSTRDVMIMDTDHAYLVRYVRRKKGQRYLAAQFDKRDHTLASVIEWIKKQPHLNLIGGAVR